MSVHSVEEWLAKAEEDYGGAIDLARKRKEPRPNLVCFHGQQAAEKYLKAFLVRHKIEFPKTHDLRSLANQCAQIDGTFAMIEKSLLTLTYYAVDFRYPGENATVEEAREAVDAMKEVRKFVRARLGLK